MLTTPKLKELQRPTLISCYKLTKFHAILLNGYGEMPSKLCGLLLLTGRCYGAEISVILLLLNRAFTWYPFCKVFETSPFHQNFE